MVAQEGLEPSPCAYQTQMLADYTTGQRMVGETGVEPARPKTLDPKSSAAAISPLPHRSGRTGVSVLALPVLHRPVFGCQRKILVSEAGLEPTLPVPKTGVLPLTLLQGRSLVGGLGVEPRSPGFEAGASANCASRLQLNLVVMPRLRINGGGGGESHPSS